MEGKKRFHPSIVEFEQVTSTLQSGILISNEDKQEELPCKNETCRVGHRTLFIRADKRTRRTEKADCAKSIATGKFPSRIFIR